MNPTKILLALLATLPLAACMDDPYRSLYDGIRNRNELKKTPIERANYPSPSYDEYKRERDKQE